MLVRRHDAPLFHDRAAAEDDVAVIEDEGLAGRDRALRSGILPAGYQNGSSSFRPQRARARAARCYQKG